MLDWQDYWIRRLVCGLHGEERSCLGKIGYDSFACAQRAAEKHNNWDFRSHRVHVYHCCFCEDWHAGKEMSLVEMKAYVERNVDADSQDI